MLGALISSPLILSRVFFGKFTQKSLPNDTKSKLLQFAIRHHFSRDLATNLSGFCPEISELFQAGFAAVTVRTWCNVSTIPGSTVNVFSSSASVVYRPIEKRTEPSATDGSIPIAPSTGDGAAESE